MAGETTTTIVDRSGADAAGASVELRNAGVGLDLQALPRRERVRALMRQDILDAARRLVQEEGIRGLTMRALGRAVGVTAPTLYDYFASKEAVLDALFVQGTQLLSHAFVEASAASRPGRDRLMANAIAYRQFALDHPDLYFLIFGRVDASYRPGEREIDCVHNVGDQATQAIVEAMEIGEIRPGDPEAAAYATWVMAHGHITLELSGFCDKYGEDADDRERMYLRNFELLFDGLAPSEAPGARNQAPGEAPES
jgi:AcrR family transcriptional regulator